MAGDGFSKCHPVTNLLFFLGAICFGVVFQHPAYLLAGLICSGLYYLLLQGRKALKAMALILPLLLAVTLVNPLFNTQGEHILFMLWGRPYTFEALLYGFATGAMLTITLLWFGCYNHIMTEDKFTALLGNLAPALSLLLVMVFRLIPSLLRKAKQIIGARQGIRMDGQNGGTKEKLRQGMTVLLTLTGWALEDSIQTADSMRSRGYGTAKRSSFQIYTFTLQDYLALAGILLTAGLTIWGAATGAVAVTYTPAFSAASISAFFPIYCVYLLIPTLIHGKEALLCRIFISKI